MAPLPVRTQGFSGDAGTLTSARRMAAVAVIVFPGDNGPESKSDSRLRGNAGTASKLIKQLTLQGTACLILTLEESFLPLYGAVKKEKKKEKRKNLALFNYGACHSFIVNSFS